METPLETARGAPARHAGGGRARAARGPRHARRLPGARAPGAGRATSASSATRRRRWRGGTTRRSRRNLGDAVVFLLDPMLATGGLRGPGGGRAAGLGARHVRLLSIVAAPEGVAHLAAVAPDAVDLHGRARPRAERPQVHPARPRRLRRPALRDVIELGGASAAPPRPPAAPRVNRAPRRGPLRGLTPAAPRKRAPLVVFGDGRERLLSPDASVQPTSSQGSPARHVPDLPPQHEHPLQGQHLRGALPGRRRRCG